MELLYVAIPILVIIFVSVYLLLNREVKNDPKKMLQLLDLLRLISENVENQWLVGDTLEWWKIYRGFPKEMSDLKIQLATVDNLRRLKEVIKTKKYLLYGETSEKLSIYFNRERKDTIVIYKEKKKPTLVEVDFYCIPTNVKLEDFHPPEMEERKAKLVCENR